MTRTAERVCISDAEIAHLEMLVTQLPYQARVELVLDDDSTMVGTVAVRPTVQTFIDPDGQEGVNDLLRIDDAADPSQLRWIWLDRIREVRRLDPVR